MRIQLDFKDLPKEVTQYIQKRVSSRGVFSGITFNELDVTSIDELREFISTCDMLGEQAFCYVLRDLSSEDDKRLHLTILRDRV